MAKNTDLLLRQLAAAAEQLKTREMLEAFDPTRPGSKPTKAQQEIIDAVLNRKARYITVRAGNQCLAKGTLVMTPGGATPIELIEPGDYVYSEDGNLIKVLKTFENGVKPVYGIYRKHELLAEATAEHVWLTVNGEKKTIELTDNAIVVFNNPAVQTEIKSTRLTETYDLHVDSPTNLYLLANGLVTHNSGKSSTGAKAFATMFREDGITWQRPPEWSDSLQFYILGRTSKQVEESLHRRIMSHVLEPDAIREVRQGGALQKVIHKHNGNTILYFSHHNTNQAQQAVQSFTGHGAWCDELPHSERIIEELSKRVMVNGGTTLLTFTPKVPNPAVKQFLDALPPHLAMTIRLSMLENPAIDDEEKQIQLDTARVMGDAMMKTILEGDWLVGERGVYNFSNAVIQDPPPHYSPAWRHVESSDPAAASEHGLVVAAEDPVTGHWYVIKSDYIKSKNPIETINEVMRRTAGLNIVRRIYDTAATWYTQLAAAQGIAYVGVYKKSDRKLDMISATNQLLGTKLFIASWCKDLIDELQSAQWSEVNPTKISHAHDYHLTDALNYFVDCKPKYDGNNINYARTWDQQIREYNQKKYQDQEKAPKIRRSAWGRPWTRW